MDLHDELMDNYTLTQKFKSDFVDFHRVGFKTKDFNYTSIVNGLREFTGSLSYPGSLSHLKWVDKEHRLYALPDVCVLSLYTDIERQTIVFSCPQFKYLKQELGINETELQRTANKIPNVFFSFMEGICEYKNQETKRFPADASCLYQAGWVSESIVQKK
jgi:hypothetical protein